MDMKISGAGVLSGGEYDEVRINGSAKLEGDVRCKSFSAAGSAKGEGKLLCEEDFRVAGSAQFTGEISAKTAEVSGALKCAALTVEKDTKLSGGVELSGGLSGGEVLVSGELKTGEGIEAETFRFCTPGGPVMAGGKLKCSGLLNAETVEIVLGLQKHSVGSIGGGSVTVKGAKEEGPFPPFGGFPAFAPFGAPWGKPPQGSLNVSESIEADRVELENTVCPLVTGRTVKIGKGCKIGTVRYSESLDVDSKAEVETQEKV